MHNYYSALNVGYPLPPSHTQIVLRLIVNQDLVDMATKC